MKTYKAKKTLIITSDYALLVRFQYQSILFCSLNVSQHGNQSDSEKCVINSGCYLLCRSVVVPAVFFLIPLTFISEFLFPVICKALLTKHGWLGESYVFL